ncbi:alpha/beta hydrolase [Actibacterium sp. MT2.3-13A]|uniref:alpha/beta fold hydrolase n=1 Tax=Actibacterium sp. MT2.3-13A TaxID=2828332 RepID=UPI001BA9BF01|nr:alpha/beta hydrolase [Actibacterium sp. MT2.3-13A]
MTTLLLIPGLVSDSRVWRHVAAAAPAGFAPENADVTRDCTIPAMARRLLEEFDGPLLPVGHSMGGRVAMEMARQAPDRVRGLVLANTGHNALTEGELPKRQAKIALAHADMAGLAAEWLPPMLAPARRDDAALVAELTEMVLAAGPQVHERQIRALIDRPDAAAYLPAIACPILLLTGTEDGWSPEQQHREIADLAPDAELQVIADAGHFMPVERPAETVAAINGWLSRHEEALHD